MKRFKKLILCIISVCCIIVSMCPISAFASPEIYYPIASDKPTVTDYSGYVELLFENVSSGQRFVTVLGWFFTPYLNTSSDSSQVSDKPVLTIVRNASQFRLGVSTNEGVSGNLSFISIDTGSQINFGYIDVPDNQATYYYPVTYGNNYRLVGMHYYGDFASVNVDSGLSNAEFYVTYGSDTVISYGLNQIISSLYSLIDATGQETYKDELDSILNELNSIDSTLTDFRSRWLNTMNSLFELFGEVLVKLDDIIENTDELEGKLDEVISYLISIDNWLFNINDWTMNSYIELYEIHSIVQSILNVLNIESDIPAEKLTQPDNSDMDNYYDVENGLLDNGNVDVNGAVNVQVNQNAMTVIWDLVESALNSHSKVIGMVLTILALGIVALILGR